MTDKTDALTIRTQAGLETAWRALMGPWGYGRHSLWLMVLLDDVPIPQLTEVEVCTEPPDATGTEQFNRLLARLSADLGPGCLRFAMLRTRPGSSHVEELDRAWARSLYDACALAGAACEVVHLGTQDQVRALPPDEVIPASA